MKIFDQDVFLVCIILLLIYIHVYKTLIQCKL